jgi:hypothetical protein
VRCGPPATTLQQVLGTRCSERQGGLRTADVYCFALFQTTRLGVQSGELSDLTGSHSYRREGVGRE